MTEKTIRPRIIISIKGKYCAGCTFAEYGRCVLFSEPLQPADMGLLRCKKCLKAG